MGGGVSSEISVHIIHHAQPRFLDANPGKKTLALWGDGVNLGGIPINLTWNLRPVPGKSGVFYIIHQAEKRFIDANPGNNQIWLWGDGNDVGGAPVNLQWEIRDAGEGLYTIVHQAQKRFLDAHAGDSSVTLWGDGVNLGGAPQNLKWKIIQAKGLTGSANHSSTPMPTPSDSRESKEIFLVKFELKGCVTFAHHHAIKIGDEVFEVAEGSGCQTTQPIFHWNWSRGYSDEFKRRALYDQRFAQLIHLGSTNESAKSLIQWADDYKKKHFPRGGSKNGSVYEYPDYKLLTNNCQGFVLTFCHHLGCDIPVEHVESNIGAQASGPSARARAANGRAEASATAGKAGAQYGGAGVYAQGPTASASASVSDGSISAFAEADVAKVGANVGPIRVEAGGISRTGASFGVNNEVKILGTGAAIGRDKCEVSLLGLGIRLW